ncbi:xanthine phosphoribosyltransferase [Peptoniphilus equinus]|uniref:Xanthine phosphoribosyltransferase n=1 Tax=Peptoniphilus equinus TaxID=3016343 RepID=A0ABY7QUV4_9FIRM|nr:xanthine phosphoribosyltransferase [Peptoniphilus equinus]WBW50201.1 xanthine phosphoribosyltransferase [Peptoniphilus equinus]
MKELEQRILLDGRVLPGEVVKVDSFLNHQLDVAFLSKMGQAIYDRFKDQHVTKILTIEASGIAIAVLASTYFGNVPVVFAKKGASSNIGTDFYTAPVHSYTKNKDYNVIVSKRYLSEEDRVLIIDDFLAEGQAMTGMMSLCDQANATIVGLSVAIEKGFQSGGKKLREAGYNLDSLAIIESIEDEVITFRPQ